MHFDETLSLVIFSFDLVVVSIYSYKKTPRKVQALPPNFPVSKFFLHGQAQAVHLRKIRWEQIRKSGGRALFYDVEGEMSPF